MAGLAIWKGNGSIEIIRNNSNWCYTIVKATFKKLETLYKLFYNTI